MAIGPIARWSATGSGPTLLPKSVSESAVDGSLVQKLTHSAPSPIQDKRTGTVPDITANTLGPSHAVISNVTLHYAGTVASQAFSG